MSLAVSLATSQIEAAKRLYDRLPQWKLTDEALALLSEQLPGFAPREALIKAAAINALYSTNVKAVVPVARHVSQVLQKPDSLSRGPELVETLASVPPEGTKMYPRFRSFASKFASFFIDAERFPIMDTYSIRMVKLHIGKRNYADDEGLAYLAFVENYENLKSSIGYKGSNRDLDRYFWLSGEYLEWKKNNDAEINSELRSIFEKPDPETSADLNLLVEYYQTRSATDSF
jgi:hypothetical protein